VITCLQVQSEYRYQEEAVQQASVPLDCVMDSQCIRPHTDKQTDRYRALIHVSMCDTLHTNSTLINTHACQLHNTIHTIPQSVTNRNKKMMPLNVVLFRLEGCK